MICLKDNENYGPFPLPVAIFLAKIIIGKDEVGSILWAGVIFPLYLRPDRGVRMGNNTKNEMLEMIN